MSDKLRRIVKNGNSLHVSIPPRVLDQLRWHAGDHIVLEVHDVDTLIIRAARVADLRSPFVPAPVDVATDKVHV